MKLKLQHILKTSARTIALAIAAVVGALNASAVDYVDSYKYDIGLSLGMSSYLGDANESTLFHSPGVAAAASMRYIFDNRWAAKAQLSMATIKGNTADFDYVLPDARHYSFKSTLFDLTFRGEANFFAYGIGETYKRLRRWTPYLALGFGLTMASSDGHTVAAFSIPIGVGIKYKISRRLNLNAEFCMTKTFSDKIDSPEIADLYQIKSSFLKNTDWYSTLTVGISYEFGPRCATCHRID